MALARQAGNELQAMDTLVLLARTAADESDYDLAIRLHQQTAVFYRQLNYTAGTAAAAWGRTKQLDEVGAIHHYRLAIGIVRRLQTEQRTAEMAPMKTPVFSALLVAITLVCTPPAAVLAKEATVVQLRLHGTYEDTLPPENPFGPRLLHFKGLLDLIREATADQNIAALYLKSEAPRLGLAKVPKLVQALQECKAAGKRIYARSEERRVGKECRSRWS